MRDSEIGERPEGWSTACLRYADKDLETAMYFFHRKIHFNTVVRSCQQVISKHLRYVLSHFDNSSSLLKEGTLFDVYTEILNRSFKCSDIAEDLKFLDSCDITSIIKSGGYFYANIEFTERFVNTTAKVRKALREGMISCDDIIVWHKK